jgi:recombination protein RecR
MTMLKTNKVNEVILANNWTINGEATAAFIKKIINELAPNANVYRLAIGLPINSALDYADNTTLRHAINNKTKY